MFVVVRSNSCRWFNLNIILLGVFKIDITTKLAQSLITRFVDIVKQIGIGQIVLRVTLSCGRNRYVVDDILSGICRKTGKRCAVPCESCNCFVIRFNFDDKTCFFTCARSNICYLQHNIMIVARIIGTIFPCVAINSQFASLVEITFVYRPTYCNAADDVRFALAVEIIDIDLRMEGTGIGLCAVRALSTRSRGVCGIAVTIRLARCSFGIFDIAHGFAFRSGYADGSVTQIAVERQRFAF